MTTKLTAADLVVGQSYLVLVGGSWAKSAYLYSKFKDGWWHVFLGTTVAEKDIEKHVRPLEPQTFPDPPPGRKWHNPEGLTPEQVGVAEGWRLCLEDEVANIPHEGRIDDGVWRPAILSDGCFDIYGDTYRTKHPIDSPPPVETAYHDDLDDHNWYVLQRENAALWQRILELEEEVRRNSWRPVSEKPEEGDADAEGCVNVLWEKPDGSRFVAQSRVEYVRKGTNGVNRVTHWRPANMPPVTEDQKFARWKAAASEEDRDAAMRAGWKGGAA